MISKLATYVNTSTKHQNKMTNKVNRRITIHCTAGNKNNTGKDIIDYFIRTDRGASANYCVGGDGSIACGVDESNRAWTSSSRANDEQAVTIEVCSNPSGTEVNTAAIDSTVKLCIDIMKRYGKNKAVFTGNANYEPASNEMLFTWHRMFANTSCPGPYIMGHFNEIINRINAGLTTETKKTETKEVDDMLYRVQVGAYRVKTNAENMLQKLKNAGFEGFIVEVDDGTENKTTAPKKATKSNEEIAREVLRGDWGNGADRVNRLKAAGYDYTTIQNIVNKLAR